MVLGLGYCTVSSLVIAKISESRHLALDSRDNPGSLWPLLPVAFHAMCFEVKLNMSKLVTCTITGSRTQQFQLQRDKCHNCRYCAPCTSVTVPHQHSLVTLFHTILSSFRSVIPVCNRDPDKCTTLNNIIATYQVCRAGTIHYPALCLYSVSWHAFSVMQPC